MPRADRVVKTSIMLSSLCEYCHSLRSFKHRVNDCWVDGNAVLSSSVDDLGGPKAYVAGGGKKASLAAIRDGNGGQQNRQQMSLNDSPFIFLVAIPAHIQNIAYHTQETSNKLNDLIKRANRNNIPEQISYYVHWSIAPGMLSKLMAFGLFG